ncbi:MAG: ATPase [Opitutae bacterium]|nr:ATPase [Opitutae bacterium]
MYTEFFGLRERPFDLLPNPDFLFPSRAHKRALTYLVHGVRSRAGFILLTGEVGSGKTTIIRNLIRTHLKDSIVSKVFNTKVDSRQLLAQINGDFGLETDGQDKAALLRDLHDFLIDQYAERHDAVLIIDEAQNLSPEILEEVRMLSNLETDRDKLLQIILVGQPELRTTLALPGLLQLRQRIQINCHIQPLSAPEVGEYILYRLEKAGNREALDFDPEAIEAVAAYSRGIPRLVNIMCDYILVDAFSAQSRFITGQAVHELAADLAFDAQYWDAAPAPASGTWTAGGERGGDQGDSASLSRGVAVQSKVVTMLGELNRRIASLEALPVWDHSALLGLQERVERLETGLESRIRELRQGQHQLRLLATQYQPPPATEDAASKRPGTWRAIWNFLWGE